MKAAFDRVTLARIRPVALATVLIGVAGFTGVQAEDPDPERFADDMAAFAEWDSKNTAPADAILFVGSSSIRRWNTADWFPDRVVINRGFGGSHISDVNYWLEETVLKYEPAVVVHYAGDNDTAAGKSPRRVFEDFQEFASRVLEALPEAQVLVISIKPSLARWEVWPQMTEANALIREFTEGNPRLHFADVGDAMIGPDGEPIPEIFIDDGLHMTDAGNRIWAEVVGSELEEIGH